MRTSIVSVFAACLFALAPKATLADGVPIITPGPAIPANHSVHTRWNSKGHPEFVKLHPIVLHPGALGSDTLTVSAQIDGKEHRFVRTGVFRLPGFPDSFAWMGTEGTGGDQAKIDLSKYPSGEIGGFIILSPSRFLIIDSPNALRSSSILIEQNPRRAVLKRSSVDGGELSIRELEDRGFVSRLGKTFNVFHGRVSRRIDRTHAEVEVIEVFSGRTEKRRLLESVPGAAPACGAYFSKNEEFIYITGDENWVHCSSRLRPTHRTIERMRAISRRT